MIFKSGVEPWLLVPQVVLALNVCEYVYDKYAKWNDWDVNNPIPEMTVTSLNDGQHGPRSHHYKGRAWDLRVHNIDNPQDVFVIIRNRLKPMGFDIILEGIGTKNAHIHGEYDPKGSPPRQSMQAIVPVGHEVLDHTGRNLQHG